MVRMRLRSSHRRRLEQLLHIAGSRAIAVAIPWVQHWRSTEHLEPLEFLLRSGPAVVKKALEKAAGAATDDSFADCRNAYLLEELLAVTQAQDRRRRGVYYTPVEIVRYIVQAVDRALVEQLGFKAGLASTNARILDPAAGSGLFLAEAIRTIHARMHSNLRSLGCDAAQIQILWNQYVSGQLLSHLAGWEIMPEGVVAAHCLLADTLHETGYAFADCQRLPVEQRDALAPPDGTAPFNVVLGNPPYASLSTAAHGWIEGLIQSPHHGYMTVDGQPLGEQKHWLHDDYVKFLRLAQWHVQQASSGVVGLVTNHGYLENASFRGMRAALLQTFPRIDIVDLHGNAKMHERSPDGTRDENVFGIASGAAIGIFTRPDEPPLRTEVRRADLWGSRAGKLQQLASLDGTTPLFSPMGPHYRFWAPQVRAASRYDTAWRLCDAMPVSTTAPVTARDGFVVGFTREELVERMESFRDLSIPDEVIRARFFSKTRSSQHPPGDSRSWKLGAARSVLASDPAWQDCLRLCQYRPLDYRYALWHDALVDWPRREVLKHLLERPNVALISRRQSPSGLPANFFWATHTLALDGIIRSDNRGSESLFPLWRFGDDGAPRANFATGFVADCEQSLGKKFIDRYESLSSTDQPTQLTPLVLAGYIYGLFWSVDYRRNHQQELSLDFPRILPPDNVDSFFALSRQGIKLLQLHTQLPASDDSLSTSGDKYIAAGFPMWQDGRVWINSATAIAELSAAAWELRIGAHQAARKWLKDRRGRQLLPAEIAAYGSIAAVLTATCQGQPKC